MKKERTGENGNIPKMGIRPALILAAISGVLLSAGFLVDPLFFTGWFALVPLLYALEGQETRRGMLLGWVTGFTGHVLGFYWLVDTMVIFGGIPYAISLVLFFLISLAFGLIHLLFAFLYTWGSRGIRAGSLWQALFISVLYTSIEFLYPHVFPWRLGNTQIAWLPVVQVAEVTGVYGITFLVAFVNALLFQILLASQDPSVSQPWPGIVVTGMLGSIVVGFGYWRLAQIRPVIDTTPSFRIALLQPNVDISEKYDRRFAERQLRILSRLSRKVLSQGAQLIIWPETAYPYWIPTAEKTVPLPLKPPPSTWFLIGANTFSKQPDKGEAFNSALLISAQEKVLGRYDKQKLLMFGEYIPLESSLPFLKGISTAIGDFTPGYGAITLQIPAGPIIAPLICYEDILPSLARKAVEQGAQVLINITNDAWFGKTRAPYQHQLLARFRAIENRVPLIRATNTGVTSVIDPTGAIRAAVDIYTEATIVWDIPLYYKRTFYNRYGDLFAYLTTGIVLALLCRNLLWRRRT